MACDSNSWGSSNRRQEVSAVLLALLLPASLYRDPQYFYAVPSSSENLMSTEESVSMVLRLDDNQCLM